MNKSSSSLSHSSNFDAMSSENSCELDFTDSQFSLLASSTSSTIWSNWERSSFSSSSADSQSFSASSPAFSIRVESSLIRSSRSSSISSRLVKTSCLSSSILVWASSVLSPHWISRNVPAISKLNTVNFSFFDLYFLKSSIFEDNSKCVLMTQF